MRFSCSCGGHIGLFSMRPPGAHPNLFAMVFRNLAPIPITIPNFKNLSPSARFDLYVAYSSPANSKGANAVEPISEVPRRGTINTNSWFANQPICYEVYGMVIYICSETKALKNSADTGIILDYVEKHVLLVYWFVRFCTGKNARSLQR